MAPITNLDNYTNNIFLNLRTESLTDIFLFITNLADWPIILFLLFAISIILIRKKAYRLLVALLSINTSAFLISTLLKFLTQKPRPPLELAVYPEFSSGFTSTHSAIAISFYGFCIYLLWQTKLFPAAKIILTSILTILIILIGISRIYLGVHWLSDVVGGYTVGGLILGVGIFMLKRR